MPTPIAYSTISDFIKTTLENDSLLANCKVYVEQEPAFGAMDQPVIAIFLRNRIAVKSGEQRLSASQRIRMHLQYQIFVVAFHLESFKQACDDRNTILGNLEIVLQKNASTIGGSAENSWIEGGVIYSAKDAQSGVYVAAAETNLTVSASSITTP